MIRSRLKSKRYVCAALDESVEIQQLSALGMSEIIDAQETASNIMLGALTCKHGVVGWGEHSAEEIAAAYTADVILDLATAIDELTYPQPAVKKSSESGPVAVSS